MLTLKFSLFMEFYVPLNWNTQQIVIPVKLLQIWIDMKWSKLASSEIISLKTRSFFHFSSKIVPINSKWFNIIQTKLSIFKSVQLMHNCEFLPQLAVLLVSDRLLVLHISSCCLLWCILDIRTHKKHQILALIPLPVKKKKLTT